MPRLFVAVWPPDDVLSLIATLPRPDVEGLRWTTRDQWHVTLRFFGSVELAEASEALRPVKASSTTAVLGPATDRFGKRILHVPVDGLTELAEAVVGVTQEVGKPPEPRPFSGHLTLARARHRRRGVDLRELVGTPIAAEWLVTEVHLVESHMSSKGATYEVVETILLSGGRTLE